MANFENPYEGDQEYQEWVDEVWDLGVRDSPELWLEKGFESGLDPQEFVESYAGAEESGWSKDPEEGFADFLVDIGLRDDEWDFDIGDTGGEGE